MDTYLKDLKWCIDRWEHYNKFFDFRENTKRFVFKYENLKKFEYHKKDEQMDILREHWDNDDYYKNKKTQIGKQIMIPKSFSIITGITVTSSIKQNITFTNEYIDFTTFEIQPGRNYYPFVLPIGCCLYSEYYLKFETDVECEFEYILLPIDYMKIIVLRGISTLVPESATIWCGDGISIYDFTLRDHNKHLRALELTLVEEVKQDEFERVEILYQQLAYEPGGEKYEKSKKFFENNVK